MQKSGEDVACEACGELYYRKPYRKAAGQRFCSQECRRVGRKAAIRVAACEQCGEPVRVFDSRPNPKYCSWRCRQSGMTRWPMERMHNGKPARHTRYGYVMIWEPDHPDKTYNGWQFEHRMIMERELGRRLASDEHVDHINRVRDDNRRENLQVLSKQAHMKKTAAERDADIAALRARLAEYERRYGPLEQE